MNEFFVVFLKNSEKFDMNGKCKLVSTKDIPGFICCYNKSGNDRTLLAMIPIIDIKYIVNCGFLKPGDIG